MNKQKYFRYLLLTLVLVGAANGLLTIPSYAQLDSLRQGSPQVVDQTFTLDEFFSHILTHHPIVMRANLFDDMAFQDLRMARGMLDPVAQSDFDIKDYKGTRYYQNWDSKLKVPMWFPIDLEAGYERNRGDFLNRELENTEDGLIYAGFSIPVGRGLFIDQRRAAIRQARLMRDLAEADQVKEVNKLLFSAAKSYWDWYYAYREYDIISEIEDAALLRYNGIVQQVINGDVAPYDSLKALINYQERDNQRLQAQLDLENARLAVSVFLWAGTEDETILPLELAENTWPVLDESEEVSIEVLAALQELAMEAHPELRKLAAKFQQTEIDRRLALEFLKPQIDLKYNFLSQTVSELGSTNGNGNGNGGDQPFFFNDYKAGVQFYFPLFLRKERGKLAQTNIKLEQLYFEQSYQRQLITNGVLTTYNTLENLGQIINQQSQMVNYYRQLLDSELQLFEFGESSIFLINTRETELLDARIKLLKLQTQREKAEAELYYQAGVPNLNLEATESSE